MAEINTTPLVDVMLVLLVIFIITAPLFHQAVPIDLPQVTATKLDDKPEVIQLAIDIDGKISGMAKPSTARRWMPALLPPAPPAGTAPARRPQGGLRKGGRCDGCRAARQHREDCIFDPAQSLSSKG
jgi:hypothetical protein